MDQTPTITMPDLRAALEAAWAPDTAYRGVSESGNPSLGQCYPTSRVLQHYFPELEIVEGEVWTGTSTEKHFWNVLLKDGQEYHIDFTWQQFPPSSVVRRYWIRDRHTLGDSPATIQRCETLRTRAADLLARHPHQPQ